MIAKRRDEPYRAGERSAVVKVKPEKTADCVVAGLRWKSDGERRIATLLLGLWDDDGDLDYVGSAAVAPARHDEIAAVVLPLLEDAPERRFSEPNRWGGGELEEAPVRPRSSSRCATTRCRAGASATGRSSCGSAPTRIRRSARWRELRPPLAPGATLERLLEPAA